jgi:RNA polymerase-binding transcription factor DksA
MEAKAAAPAAARDCARCGAPIPARSRPATLLCRLCAAKAALAHERAALAARPWRRHKHDAPAA